MSIQVYVHVQGSAIYANYYIHLLLDSDVSEQLWTSTLTMICSLYVND